MPPRVFPKAAIQMSNVTGCCPESKAVINVTSELPGRRVALSAPVENRSQSTDSEKKEKTDSNTAYPAKPYPEYAQFRSAGEHQQPEYKEIPAEPQFSTGRR